MTRALTHGGYATSQSAMVARARKVQRLVARMKQTMPWLRDSDIPSCRAWAELEILGASIFGVLMQQGLFDAKGEGKQLLDKHRAIRQTQLRYAETLGMTPVARKALVSGGKEGGFDLLNAIAEHDREEVVVQDSVKDNNEDNETKPDTQEG
jgi:hypothetical protein